MPQSKYPQQLDTSVEIPAVRDNVTEISSEIINSIRSALFRIEQTLGINPQGNTGNTVAERISRSLDASGNIKAEALDRTNILTGPILDNDVSNVAAIKESKLKLDYPTTLLQDEISILNSELTQIMAQISEVSTLLSIHLSSNALNQHAARSISVEEAEVIASDLGVLSLSSNNLQSILEEFFNSHVNYSGANISSLNNSHRADQIYFDKDEVGDTIFSDSVQGAIEDLANIEAVGFRNALINTTSNGRIRKGSVFDAFENNNLGTILIESSGATYIQANGESTTTFTLTTPRTSREDISEFDILTLSGATLEEDNKEYQISEVILNGSDEVQEIVVYGGPKGSSNSGLFIQVTKNTYTTYNNVGFSCVVRPRANKTNTPDVQFLNPDCATVVTQGIDPSSLNSTHHAFNISIDDGDSININTFDSSATIQTLDSIVQKINDQFVDSHLNATAFKVRVGQCYELAIVHNVPNLTGDLFNRTIKISAGSSNDATSDLGFTSVLDQKIKGIAGNSLSLNGLILSQFGLIQEFTSETISIDTGSLTLSLFSGSFSELGVRIGDLAVITGSTISTDDGTYRIGSISNETAVLDLSGSQFDGELSEDSIVYIIRATANVGEFTFEEISSPNGSIMFDVFMSEDKNIFQSKRLEIDDELRSGSFFAIISDISRNYLTAGETATLTVSSSGYATLTDSSAGTPVYVATSGTYKIFGSDGLSFITLNVNATAAPLINKSVTIYGFDEISNNNYHMARGSFSTSLGRILGNSTDPGIPSLIDKRSSGTVDHTIIGESFIERYIEGPRNELRASGIIKGCEVLNPTFVDTGSEVYQTFSVGSGIVVVNGIRYEFQGVEDVRIDEEEDYVVVIDEKGCVKAAPYIDDPANPGTEISEFFERNVAYLASIEDEASNLVDLRLFIDHLDLKVIGDIKVSNDPNHGHFTDLRKAIAYSKRFNKMFPLMDSPSILLENGTYEFDDTLVIDFDLTISGSGPRTILTKTAEFSAGEPLTGDNVDFSTALFLIGVDGNTASSDITYGVTLKNFTYFIDAANITNVGCAIAITQPLIKNSVVISRRATFTFENIIFDGPSNMDGTVADPDKIGEFAIMVGQQNPSTLNPVSNIVMGNIIVSQCRINRMGLEVGSMKFTESASSTFRDIVVSGNIITRASPNLGSTASVLIEYPTTPTVENIIETGNVFRAGN